MIKNRKVFSAQEQLLHQALCKHFNMKDDGWWVFDESGFIMLNKSPDGAKAEYLWESEAVKKVPILLVTALKDCASIKRTISPLACLTKAFMEWFKDNASYWKISFHRDGVLSKDEYGNFEHFTYEAWSRRFANRSEEWRTVVACICENVEKVAEDVSAASVIQEMCRSRGSEPTASAGAHKADVGAKMNKLTLERKVDEKLNMLQMLSSSSMFGTSVADPSKGRIVTESGLLKRCYGSQRFDWQTLIAKFPAQEAYLKGYMAYSPDVSHKCNYRMLTANGEYERGVKDAQTHDYTACFHIDPTKGGFCDVCESVWRYKVYSAVAEIYEQGTQAYHGLPSQLPEKIRDEILCLVASRVSRDCIRVSFTDCGQIVFSKRSEYGYDPICSYDFDKWITSQDKVIAFLVTMVRDSGVKDIVAEKLSMFDFGLDVDSGKDEAPPSKDDLLEGVTLKTCLQKVMNVKHVKPDGRGVTVFNIVEVTSEGVAFTWAGLNLSAEVKIETFTWEWLLSTETCGALPFSSKDREFLLGFGTAAVKGGSANAQPWLGETRPVYLKGALAADDYIKDNASVLAKKSSSTGYWHFCEDGSRKFVSGDGDVPATPQPPSFEQSAVDSLGAMVPAANELKRKRDARLPRDWLESAMPLILDDLRKKEMHTVKIASDDAAKREKEALIERLFTEQKGYNLSIVHDSIVITYKKK